MKVGFLSMEQECDSCARHVECMDAENTSNDYIHTATGPNCNDECAGQMGIVDEGDGLEDNELRRDGGRG